MDPIHSHELLKAENFLCLELDVAEEVTEAQSMRGTVWAIAVWVTDHVQDKGASQCYYTHHIALYTCVKPTHCTPLTYTVLYANYGASRVAQTVKDLPVIQETWVWSLVWQDPLEKGMATHSSILAWKIRWTEEPGGIQSMGSPRVRHDWVTNKPVCAVVKNPLANAGDTGSILGLGRSPGEGNGNPLQHFCLENPMDGGAW